MTHWSAPFYRTHRKNEEPYLFLSGKGEFQVNDKIIPSDEGSAMRVAPLGLANLAQYLGPADAVHCGAGQDRNAQRQ